jgi:hypothetical protein
MKATKDDVVGVITQQEYKLLLSLFPLPDVDGEGGGKGGGGVQYRRMTHHPLLPFEYLKINPPFRPDEPLGNVGSYVWPALALRVTKNFRRSILEKDLVEPISSGQCLSIQKALHELVLAERTDEVEGKKWGKSFVADENGIKKLVDSFLPAACRGSAAVPNTSRFLQKEEVPPPTTQHEGWPVTTSRARMSGDDPLWGVYFAAEDTKKK